MWEKIRFDDDDGDDDDNDVGVWVSRGPANLVSNECGGRKAYNEITLKP